MNRIMKLRLAALAVWMMCGALQACTPAHAATAVTPLDPMTITAVGPLTIINLDSTFFGMPLTLGAGGTYQSPPTKANGYATVAVHVTSTQAGTLSIQRYLDDGTLQIPQGAAVTVTLVANTVNSVSIANDGLPWDSFSYTITNSGGSTATLSTFRVKLHSGGVAKSGGSTSPNVSNATGILPVANGGTGGSTGLVQPVAGATAEYPMTEGNGTTVNDISGNGKTATFCTSSAAPTWTNYGVLFTSTKCINTPIQTWGTVYIHMCSSKTTGNSSETYQSPLQATSTGIELLQAAGPTLQYTPSIFKKQAGTFSTTTFPYNVAAQPCSVIAVSLGASDAIYINGQAAPLNASSTSASAVTTAGAYNLGFAQDGAWDGSINYAVFFPTAHTQAQVQQETAYINQQVASRPSFTGYSTPQNLSSVNQILCDGDSLTTGNGGSPWCNSTYMTLNNTYAFNINAFFGKYARDIMGDIKYFDTPEMTSNGGRNICHIWAGTNDVSGSIGFTPAQTWNFLKAIGSQYKSAGCVPVVATMISRLNSTDDGFKNTLNGIIRANWQASGFAALDDLAAIPGLGADGAHANPTFTCFGGDNIHLINTGTSCYNGLSGYPTVGWNFARVVNILDGATAANPTVTTSNAYTQLIADNFVLQTPSGAATDVLPDCTGLTGIQRTIVNGSGANAITVSSAAGLSITGSTTVAANATATYTCELTGPTTGGNYWLRTQ